MYSILAYIEQGAILLLLALSLAASSQASKLIVASSEKEMHLNARMLKHRIAVLGIIGVIAIAADITISAIAHPVFWMDRLALHVPLLLLAASLLWFLAVPRLNLLIRRTRAMSDKMPDAARIRFAADTALRAPFRLSALLSLGCLYFIIVPPVPFRPFEVGAPLAVLLIAGLVIWRNQMTRYHKDGIASWIGSPPSLRRSRFRPVAVMVSVAALPLWAILNSGFVSDRSSAAMETPIYGLDGAETASPASLPFADTQLALEARPYNGEMIMILDNKLSFYNGTPSLYDTINGKVFPESSAYTMQSGDLVKTTVMNRDTVNLPMQLKDCYLLVLSRNGEIADGRAEWLDTLDVAPGEVYEIALLAKHSGSFRLQME
ncbi:hypothetical protein ACFQZE_20830 [Paenibacillus sp. GCM10027627]|uniref:hypothetical protein n=1 Tax=unclassified Paenibacillus TaxID=185978 RepID=UPI00363B8C98